MKMQDGEVLNTHFVVSSDLYCASGHPVHAVSVGLKAPSIKCLVGFPTLLLRLPEAEKSSQSIPFPFFPSLNSGPLCMFKGFFLADFQL